MKKKAFTLTELLVVVVIIGVLSAVVLPKFTKVLESRKTTEAENIMTAVRNEQEARCMLDKDYTGDADKLASLPKGGSKHFSYTLDEKGITATGSDYVLQIPSYTDGRICCVSGCDKLNKDYPLCSELNPDPAACSGKPPCTGAECEPSDPCEGKENEHVGDSAWEWTGVAPSCWREVPSNSCEGRENDHDTNPFTVTEDGCQVTKQWAWNGREDLSCWQLEEKNRVCSTSSQQQEERTCGCGGKQHRTVTTITQADGSTNVEAGEWGECVEPEDASCPEVCNGTPKNQRECQALVWGPGGNTCTVLVRSDVDTEDHDSSEMSEPTENTNNRGEDEDTERNNRGHDENVTSHEPTYKNVSIDSGRVCNENCKWQVVPCPRTGSGGTEGEDPDEVYERETWWGEWKSRPTSCRMVSQEGAVKFAICGKYVFEWE